MTGWLEGILINKSIHHIFIVMTEFRFTLIMSTIRFHKYFGLCYTILTLRMLIGVM